MQPDIKMPYFGLKIHYIEYIYDTIVLWKYFDLL